MGRLRASDALARSLLSVSLYTCPPTQDGVRIYHTREPSTFITCVLLSASPARVCDAFVRRERNIDASRSRSLDVQLRFYTTAMSTTALAPPPLPPRRVPQSRAVSVPPRLYAGLTDDELHAHLRRFNKQVTNIGAVHLPPDKLDFGPALSSSSNGEAFSPEKLKSNFERVYLTVIKDVGVAVKHVTRIRSWEDPFRTAAWFIVSCRGRAQGRNTAESCLIVSSTLAHGNLSALVRSLSSFLPF